MRSNATRRWRVGVLAVLAAVSFVLTGCNDSSPGDNNPGTTQDGGY